MKKIFAIVILLVLLSGCLSEYSEKLIDNETFCIEATAFSRASIPKCDSKEKCEKEFKKQFPGISKGLGCSKTNQLYHIKTNTITAWIEINSLFDKIENLNKVCKSNDQKHRILIILLDILPDLKKIASISMNLEQEILTSLAEEKQCLEKNKFDLEKDTEIFGLYLKTNYNFSDSLTGNAENQTPISKINQAIFALSGKKNYSPEETELKKAQAIIYEMLFLGNSPKEFLKTFTPNIYSFLKKNDMVMLGLENYDSQKVNGFITHWFNEFSKELKDFKASKLAIALSTTYGTENSALKEHDLLFSSIDSEIIAIIEKNKKTKSENLKLIQTNQELILELSNAKHIRIPDSLTNQTTFFSGVSKNPGNIPEYKKTLDLIENEIKKSYCIGENYSIQKNARTELMQINSELERIRENNIGLALEYCKLKSKKFKSIPENKLNSNEFEIWYNLSKLSKDAEISSSIFKCQKFIEFEEKLKLAENNEQEFILDNSGHVELCLEKLESTNLNEAQKNQLKIIREKLSQGKVMEAQNDCRKLEESAIFFSQNKDHLKTMQNLAGRGLELCKIIEMKNNSCKNSGYFSSLTELNNTLLSEKEANSIQKELEKKINETEKQAIQIAGDILLENSETIIQNKTNESGEHDVNFRFCIKPLFEQKTQLTFGISKKMEQFEEISIPKNQFPKATSKNNTIYLEFSGIPTAAFCIQGTGKKYSPETDEKEKIIECSHEKCLLEKTISIKSNSELNSFIIETNLFNPKKETIYLSTGKHWFDGEKMKIQLDKVSKKEEIIIRYWSENPISVELAKESSVDLDYRSKKVLRKFTVTNLTGLDLKKISVPLHPGSKTRQTIIVNDEKFKKINIEIFNGFVYGTIDLLPALSSIKIESSQTIEHTDEYIEQLRENTAGNLLFVQTSFCQEFAGQAAILAKNLDNSNVKELEKTFTESEKLYSKNQLALNSISEIISEIKNLRTQITSTNTEIMPLDGIRQEAKYSASSLIIDANNALNEAEKLANSCNVKDASGLATKARKAIIEANEKLSAGKNTINDSFKRIETIKKQLSKLKINSLDSNTGHIIELLADAEKNQLNLPEFYSKFGLAEKEMKKIESSIATESANVSKKVLADLETIFALAGKNGLPKKIQEIKSQLENSKLLSQLNYIPPISLPELEKLEDQIAAISKKKYDSKISKIKKEMEKNGPVAALKYLENKEHKKDLENLNEINKFLLKKEKEMKNDAEKHLLELEMLSKNESNPNAEEMLNQAKKSFSKGNYIESIKDSMKGTSLISMKNQDSPFGLIGLIGLILLGGIFAAAKLKKKEKEKPKKVFRNHLF